MKKSLYLFLTLLLVGCSNTVSSTSSSSKISSSTSSVTSSSSVNSSVISSSSSSSSSSTVEEDKLEFDTVETSRKLILSSTNKTNTAHSSWEAEYLENGIQITSYVYDEDVFYGNIYNCGYDDNVAPSCVRLLATPWTAAYRAPPSMGFSRQEYWSGLPLPSSPKALRSL